METGPGWRNGGVCVCSTLRLYCRLWGLYQPSRPFLQAITLALLAPVFRLHLRELFTSLSPPTAPSLVSRSASFSHSGHSLLLHEFRGAIQGEGEGEALRHRRANGQPSTSAPSQDMDPILGSRVQPETPLCGLTHQGCLCSLPSSSSQPLRHSSAMGAQGSLWLQEEMMASTWAGCSPHVYLWGSISRDRETKSSSLCCSHLPPVQRGNMNPKKEKVWGQGPTDEGICVLRNGPRATSIPQNSVIPPPPWDSTQRGRECTEP